MGGLFEAMHQQWQSALDAAVRDLIAQHHAEAGKAAAGGGKETVFAFDAQRYQPVIEQYLTPVYAACGERDYLKAALEQVARAAVPSLLTNVQHLYLLYDVIHETSVRGMADPALCFALVEESCDFLTLAETEAIFSYLEDRMPILSLDMAPNKSKGLTLLRICNELVRRSSKTRNTIFCGRVRLFLASIFAPDERSGVNLNKEFNLDNITTYEETPPTTTTTTTTEDEKTGDTAMETETSEDATGPVAAAKSNSPSTPQDSSIMPTEKQADAIYEPFWQLQEYFRNPPSLLLPQHYGVFEKHMLLVLELFVAIAQHEASGTVAQKKGHVQAVAKEPAHAYFFVKFLTNKKLLNLELSDVHFRRHILVEALIVIDYLLTNTVAEKAKIKTTIQRITISEAQEKAARELRSKVLGHLHTFGPDARQFVQAVTSFLKLEDTWQYWKAMNCPSFTKHATEEQIVDRTKGRIQFAASKPRTYPAGRLPYLGKPALERLWQESGDMDTILAKIKKEEAQSRAKARDMIDVMQNYEGYERKQLGDTYAWKTQRLVLRHDLGLHPSFNQVTSAGRPESAIRPESGGRPDTGSKKMTNGPVPPLDTELYLYALHPELKEAPEEQQAENEEEPMQEDA